MKLNKFLTQLICILCVSLITACSSLKYNDSYYNTDTNTLKYKNVQNNEKIEKKTKLQLQELQDNNIIYFDFNQYNIHDEFFYILDAYSNFLCNYPLYHVKVEGHADERGTPEYNIALGERRANSVKLYLQSQGVLSHQISIISYGKEKPAVLGHTEETYAKNRRAILLLQ